MSCRAALDVRIMRIMRIMRLCDWCADCNNHPSGKSSPEPYQTAASKPPGYTGAHQLVRQVRQVRLVRHKRHANATRIPPLPSSKPAYLCGTFAPRATPSNGTANPRGIQGRTNLSDWSDWSDWSDTSATPTQHAHRRCHQDTSTAPSAHF